ncbi:MAG: formate dehydrogenase accessory sulfurtransferase FdhD [Lautropia sp.]|nr:formate dehydrogenase accessory sulfurtransferase FdhD [Lautropia sp.]
MTILDEETADGAIPSAGADKPPVMGALSLGVHVWTAGRHQQVSDHIAEEVPVALILNGISHAVMMATPDDLDDFALGFGLTEGLLQAPAELYGVEVIRTVNGFEVQMDVSSECAWRLRERRRNLAGRTGCGLCGTDSLSQVRQPLPEVCPIQLDITSCFEAERGLRQGQRLQQLTGSTHAAAWCGLDGGVQLLREDVGRHNALDKLIGAMIRAEVDVRQGFVAITSRASFEMVQKVAMARVGTLVAVSAPTALAIDTARQAGVALVGMIRGQRLVVYGFAERFGLAVSSDAPAHGRGHA